MNRGAYDNYSPSSRESSWDASDDDLARTQDTASSYSSSRPSTRDMPRSKRRVSGVAADDAVPAGGEANVFSVNPGALMNNIQTAYSAFQTIQSFTSGGAAAPAGSAPAKFELPPLPENSLVTTLLNPKNLNIPASQGVLQARLTTNLPRHGNAYLILLVGTLLATHWLVLASLFAVVKFGLLIQSYNGRDLARELGVRQYTSTQGVMSGFAAAAALVALWAFSSAFSVISTLVKVAMLVLLHAAFLDLDGGAAAAQAYQPQQQVPLPIEKKRSPKRLSSASAVTTQGHLRPAGTALPGQQLRSASEGQLVTAGWYAGEEEREEEPVVAPVAPAKPRSTKTAKSKSSKSSRTSRAFD